MRVVVVGAGLGGLCAANGLRRAGLDVQVLEAQPDLGAGRQGYRINVNQAGHAALRSCLSSRRFAAYRRTLHRQDDPAVYLYSPKLRLLSRHAAEGAPGAVDRAALRQVLAAGIAGRIRYGRRITALAEVVAGADVVVAADGVGSALRRELLPDAEPEPTGWSAIFGRSTLTGENRPWLAPAIRHSRFCGLADGEVMLALCAYDPPGAAAGYVMWVLMGPSAALPPPDTEPGGLLAYARRRTAGWDRRAVGVLRDADPAASFLTPLRQVRAIPEVPARDGVPVAFLGDAVHAMSPAGGEGANTAFADAALLVEHLAGSTAGGVGEAVRRYHADMRRSAGAAVRRSAAYAGSAHEAVRDA